VPFDKERAKRDVKPEAAGKGTSKRGAKKKEGSSEKPEENG
jgi:hypothetical protein